MGELEGIKGAWGYAEGGMGAVSQAIANSASAAGAHIFTNQVTGVCLLGFNIFFKHLRSYCDGACLHVVLLPMG